MPQQINLKKYSSLDLENICLRFGSMAQTPQPVAKAANFTIST